MAMSRWLFTPAALLFLLAAGWRARVVFASVLGHTDALPLIVTVALWALLHLLTPVFSWIVLREIGADVGYQHAVGRSTSRAGCRHAGYLPGGIWHTVSRVMDLHHLGVKSIAAVDHGAAGKSWFQSRLQPRWEGCACAWPVVGQAGLHWLPRSAGVPVVCEPADPVAPSAIEDAGDAKIPRSADI